MRRFTLRTYILALTLFVITGLGASFGQTTVVSATLTDSDSQTWNSGTWTATYFNTTPGAPSVAGQSITTSYSGSLSSGGVLSATVADTAQIVPAGATWVWTVCSALSSAQCYTTSIAVTGATQSITTQLNAIIIAPRISGLKFPSAYSDTEVSTSTANGFATYLRLSDLTLRFWNGTVWAGLGGGGGGGSVTSFSAGALSPLFTTSVATATSTPALTFTLSAAAANTVFGNCTSGSAAPSFCSIVAAMVPTLNQNTTGSAAKWTTARLLAGNSVDGSANVPFANLFIVQGTTDTGLSGAQFLGALATGIVKNTTTTGVLSIAASADVITLWSGTCSSSTFLRGDGACAAAGGGTVTSVSGTTNQIDVATGTTTPVISIDANYLLAPGPIGSGTPSTGAFTTLSASSTVSGTGFSTYLASPPAIGGSAAAAGSFTTLSASSTVSGTGFSTYLASPPAIGGSAAAAGSFTSLSSTGILSNSQAGALSASAVSITGAPVTGGSGTTTFPLVYINSGAAPTTLNTAGTMLAINSPSGFTGAFIDIRNNGGNAVFNVTGSTTQASILNATSTATFSGQLVSSKAGALNAASLSVTGAPIQTGGSGTTTFPLAYFNSGSAVSSFSTVGTVLGINAPSGFAGNLLDFHINGGASVFNVTAGGAATASLYASVTNCSSSASPAVCAAAADGSVALPTGTNPTLVVNTTAVTANSQIILTVDESLGTKLSVTCNTTLSTLLNPVVTARTAGTSFTFTIGATIATNPACVSYSIVN